MESILGNWINDPALVKLAIVVIGIILIFTFVRILRHTATRRLNEIDARYRARKFITFFGYVAATLLLIGVFSDSFAQLTVAFGVAGAGIAFALQEVIASVAGWVAISFGGFYKPGDRVQLGGIKGDVIDIGVLRTTLMECGQWINGDQYNGRIVRISNSYVFKEPVFNYSADFPFLWDEITIGVKYGSDYALAREILERVGREIVGDYAKSAKTVWQEVVRKYRLEDAAVEPVVSIIANENWMQYTLRYIVDYRARRRTKDILFTRFIQEVDKVSDRVYVAASSIEIAKLPTLNVHVESLKEKNEMP